MTTLESKTGWAKESPLLAGEMIRGRYVVEGELGHGGMGTVYLCLDEVSRVRVAVKALPPELSRDSEGLGKVLGAFPGAYGLRHPNIAGLRTLEKDDEGRYFLVIDVVEGENLRAWARRKRAETPEDGGGAAWTATALDVLRQVAGALDYAHGAGVTHGDLKPGNVMVNEQGKAKVLDFSLAGQVRTSLGRMGPREWPYLAPEQWRGRRADAKTDQYALGVMAYEMLAGHPPFENGELEVMKTAVLREKAASIPGAGRAVMKVLRRALAKSPEKRWGNCGEFVETLAGSQTKRDGKRGRKAAGWAVAAALLAAGAWWGFGGGGRGFGPGGARAWLEAILPQADAGLAAEKKRAAERWAAESQAEEERWEEERLAEERRLEEERAAAERARAEAKRKAREARAGETRRREERKREEREAAIRREQDALEATVYRLAPLAKSKAESAAEMGHDRGEGFGARLDEVRDKLAQGEEAAKGRDFIKAKACFGESMEAARWLEENAPLREEAKRARDGAAAAKERADAVGAETGASGRYRWGNDRAAAAERAFEEARFRRAAGVWREAGAAYAKAEKEARAAADRAETDQAEKARREEERRQETERQAEEQKAAEERMAAEEAARLEAARLEAERADAERAASEARQQEAEAERMAEEEERQAAEDAAPVQLEEERLSEEPAFVAVSPDSVDVPPELFPERLAGETKTMVLPGGATMEMAWCPAGSFMMGSPSWEEGRDEDETPHAVTLTRGFWLAKTEVTQRQWASVMGNHPAFHPGDDFPVENVSWNDCREFCRKAGMRLPTEAEWEYACRAGSTGAHAGSGRPEDMGWSAACSGAVTHPAGQKRANAWGLHDMHGNAWEWCEDWYQADLGTGSVTDPAGPAAGVVRVMRGGSFINAAGSCRAASRSPASPDSHNRFCGFRPVAASDSPLQWVGDESPR